MHIRCFFLKHAAVDSSSEATCKTPTKERASLSNTGSGKSHNLLNHHVLYALVDTAVLDTTMEVDQSSSDNGCVTDTDVSCAVTATSSKKGEDSTNFRL